MGMSDRGIEIAGGVDRSPLRSGVAIWLLGLALMVLIQVLLGGITRLSESGLSIMEWAPIMGALPPLSETEWRRIFDIYRQTGEYRLVNAGLDLDGFKEIFWWEYIHRLWARAIVPAFLLPYVWFWRKGALPASWARRLALIFCLGGLQGALGWVMVASGFSDRTDVSQYRLVAHLMLALAIFALLVWAALSIDREAKKHDGALRLSSPSLRRWGRAFLAVLAVQIAIGGLVAGMDAGLVYNSFPLMGAGVIPAELGATDPLWLDPFENPASAQFLHRATALLVAVIGAILSWRAIGVGETRAAIGLLILIVGQIALGIATLLSMVDMTLAVAHQATAFILFGYGLALTHRWSRGMR